MPKTHYVSVSDQIDVKSAQLLLAFCAKLAQEDTDTIYLMLSSPGGNVREGIQIYNTLRALPCEVITHNMGAVDSIANVVFQAGDKRYSCPHASFMFHGVGQTINQNIRLARKDLQERLVLVQSDQQKMGAIIVERTNLTSEEVDQMFLEAATRNPAEALEKGIIDEICDPVIPKGASISQLVVQR